MVKLNNNFLGTAIGTNFAPPCTCIFMEKVETEFLEPQVYKLLVWFRYIDDVFLIWTHGEKKLRLFLKDLHKKDLIKFTHEANKECITFLGVRSNCWMVKFLQISLLNLQTVINFSITHLRIQNTPNVQQSLAKHWELVRYVPVNPTLLDILVIWNDGFWKEDTQLSWLITLKKFIE